MFESNQNSFSAWGDSHSYFITYNDGLLSLTSVHAKVAFRFHSFNKTIHPEVGKNGEK